MAQNHDVATDMESYQDGRSTEISPTEKPKDETIKREPEYLTGFRLISLVVSTTTVGFLMLLDSSIVSTVSAL